MIPIFWCDICRHLNEGGETCKAFPEGIPEEIFIGDIAHTKPYPGDNDIQFEPIEKTKEEPK